MPPVRPILPVRPIRPLIHLLLCSSLLISSCATILNGPAQKIRVAGEKNITAITIENSLPADSADLQLDRIASFIVPRSPKPLVIHYRLDTTEKTLSLRPRNSLAFWINIWFNYGAGMLIDWQNPKRYSYPSWTYLSATDTTISHHRFPPIPAHTVRLSLVYSPVNLFNVTSPDGQLATGGMIGFEGGLDYFYQRDRYVSMSLGVGTSALPVDYFGKFYLRTANALYANIRNNYVIGSFDLGFGVNISQMEWVRTTFGDTVNRNTQIKSAVYGLSLSAQYRIGNSLRIGLSYQPDFINTTRSPVFDYQHFIAVQLCWKIPGAHLVPRPHYTPTRASSAPPAIPSADQTP